jgi:hypothetical protein
MGSRVQVLLLIVCVAGAATTIRAQTPLAYPAAYPDAVTPMNAMPREHAGATRPLPPVQGQQTLSSYGGYPTHPHPAPAVEAGAPVEMPTCWDDPTVGPTFRVFEPKARVYFDTGWEAPDKLNIFHDGSLVPSLNFLELVWRRRWPDGVGHRDWRWGPSLGVGISSQAGDSTDGTLRASGAPVLMLSAGLLTEFPLSTWQLSRLRQGGYFNPDVERELVAAAPTAGIEFGYALGVSSDESLDYSADGAIYVGVSLHVLR